MVVVVKWGDDDGTNWTVELTGLPAPHRCLEAAEIIATELRTKYRLEKDQFTQDELTALLLNETLAEVGLGWIPSPPWGSVNCEESQGTDACGERRRWV